ncbi:LytTR family DNA-binding domain-containing protein [Flavobacterium sp. I-SCBP12n]|uniref:LytTR family DNA-binding domain-containing protein n=1 Tax=Flavobacterium pygoscelis TaxID=2893176 RepID=A0A9X1XW81_9FLAO|nr:LytTR family DNA-binding domain-containing protein [Flavobacterium pygoscelis]MCK8142798.1 LytTR family DNA-binding domain-containing protein [Flavobacterium pygoscelis]
MKILKCLIVDDEPPAIRLLEKYVSKVPFLDLKASTTSSLEALSKIEEGDIDLVFMDVQMPDLTGLQLSKIVKGKTNIIFTTAYPQFALQSYEVDAVDYLLKPFEFERFYEAVLKVKNSFQSEIKEVLKEADEFIFIKTDGKNNFEKVYVKDICYIEGLKNYVAIHLNNKQIITNNTLKSIEDFLPASEFIKTHKSFIVSMRHISKTDSLCVYINEKCIPIGDTFKKELFEIIQQKKL